MPSTAPGTADPVRDVFANLEVRRGNAKSTKAINNNLEVDLGCPSSIQHVMPRERGRAIVITVGDKESERGSKTSCNTSRKRESQDKRSATRGEALERRGLIESEEEVIDDSAKTGIDVAEGGAHIPPCLEQPEVLSQDWI